VSARYASRTEVPASRSVAEISELLRRHGASQFVQGWDDDRRMAAIEFMLATRRIRFLLPMPDRRSREFTHQTSRTWIERSEAAADAAYEQAIRQRWRALLLVLRAKLEAVAAGIVTIEDEFLAQTVLPDGRTVGELAKPAIEAAYAGGEAPALLPGLNGGGQR
jgi:hypothetical protein